MSKLNDLVSKAEVLEVLSKAEEDCYQPLTDREKRNRLVTFHEARRALKQMPATVDLDNILWQLQNAALDYACSNPTVEERGIQKGLDFAVKLIEAALELEQGYKNKPVATESGEPVSLPYLPVPTAGRRLLLIPWNTVFTNTNPVCYEKEWYEGFYVTYQEKDPSISTSDTTRLVLGNLQKVFTLQGDHSRELKKASEEGGFEACLEYIQTKLAEEKTDSPQRPLAR